MSACRLQGLHPARQCGGHVSARLAAHVGWLWLCAAGACGRALACQRRHICPALSPPAGPSASWSARPSQREWGNCRGHGSLPCFPATPAHFKPALLPPCSLVNALVADFITPLISAIWGGTSFNDLYFSVNGSKFMYGSLSVSSCARLAGAAAHHRVSQHARIAAPRQRPDLLLPPRTQATSSTN